MNKNTAVPHATERYAASRGKSHLAHTLVPSFRTLLFLLAAGIFLFSCKEDIKLSSEASMTSLTLTIESTDYKIAFTGTQGTITVPYATPLPVTATVKAVQLSAKAKGVRVGQNVTIPASGSLTLTVTAENGTTKKIYTVTVKKADPRSDALITSLTLRVEDSDYEIAFTDGAYTLILPAGSTLPTAVGVKEIALSAGATGVVTGDALTVTGNTLTLTVTAEDGETESVYTVTFSVAANESASITSLMLTAGSTDYEITFQGTQGSVTLPYGTPIPSTVSVASVVLSAGATGVVTGDALIVTNNAVAITVTAEDGETESVYTVTFSVGDNNADAITSLTLNVGGSDYEVTFENGQGSVILPSGTAIPSTVSVASVALSAGATGVATGDELTVTDNALTLTVTAEDGETESVYTVTFSVGDNNADAITSLTLNVAGSDYEVTFENGQGSVILPPGTATPSTVSVSSVGLSDGVTGLTVGNEFTVTGNTLTLTVTAEDGETESVYTVTFSVAANEGASITSLTLTVEDTDYEITFQGTQGSVTLPYGTPIPSTVSVASVALFAGATGVVTGDALIVTNNAVTITVTAEDGETESAYTVTFSVAANSEASITSLILTVGSADYEITFEDRQDTVTLPYGTPIPTAVGVKQIALSAGAAGVAAGDELTVTNNAVTLTVTAEDGETTQEYTVTVRNAAASREASITSLTLTVGSADYEITFEDRQDTVTVPYATTIPTTVSVASVVLSAGATGVVTGAEFTVTNNTVTLTVTAEDGETTQEYTVTVEKEAPSNEAFITSLTLTVEETDYEPTFTGTQDTLRVGPIGTPIPTGVVVKEITLSDGAASDIGNGNALTVTDNTVTLTVTAEDGTTTNAYTVRLAESVGITSFTFEVADNENMALDEVDRQRIVGTIDHQAKTIIFDEQSAYVYRDKLKATFELSEERAEAQVGGADQVSGVTEQDFTSPVSYVVRAADGTETTYTVTLTKSTMAMIPGDRFRLVLKAYFPAAFTGDQMDITHDVIVNKDDMFDLRSPQTPDIVSMKGIEFFTSLTRLDCSGHLLTSLDMRKNTALTELGCNRNSITSLDVSANTALTSLECNNNSLESLDVSKNTALMTLVCHNNKLASLDVSKNTALTTLWCSQNSLTFLDMTGMRTAALLLDIGEGTGTDNPLLVTLRVNTALQDAAEVITMQRARGTNLTLTTVNNEGTVVCNNYIPAEDGGTCNDNF